MPRKPKDPAIDHDNPEWTEADFAKSKRFAPGTSLEAAVEEIKRGRGRPKTGNAKEAVKLRIDADVIERYGATGPGWQTKMNDALRRGMPRSKPWYGENAAGVKAAIEKVRKTGGR